MGPAIVPPLSLRGRRPWQSASPAVQSTARPPPGDGKKTDCHGANAPRNDSGGWRLVLLFCIVGIEGTAGAMPPALPSEFHTPSVSQRPVGKFYSTAVKQNPPGPNWPPALPGDRSRGPNGLIQPPACQNELSAATRRKKSPASEEPGDFYQKSPNSIRRAGTSDWSGGFCSPYGSQNLKSRIVSGHWPQQKDHPGGGWSFYPIPARGAGVGWKRQFHPGALHPTQAL